MSFENFNLQPVLDAAHCVLHLDPAPFLRPWATDLHPENRQYTNHSRSGSWARALRSTSTSRSNPVRWHSTHQKKGNRPPCWIDVCGYMYICKYVYVYIHVHTHIYIYMYAHTHIFMCMYKYVYIYVLYVCVHIYVYIKCICTCVRIYTFICLCVYTCIHMHMHVCACICTYVYIQTTTR